MSTAFGGGSTLVRSCCEVVVIHLLLPFMLDPTLARTYFFLPFHLPSIHPRPLRHLASLPVDAEQDRLRGGGAAGAGERGDRHEAREGVGAHGGRGEGGGAAAGAARQCRAGAEPESPAAIAASGCGVETRAVSGTLAVE